LKEWEPAAVRLALLDHHYRPDWEWGDTDMPRAAERLGLWRSAPRPDPGAPVTGDPGLEGVRAALDDDLDTPGALGALDREARHGRPVVQGAGLLGVTL
jgi:L-cysteine:1D-myo-inositol 2-amino-2-deoxy-alpha-D-glucopyranoside ligase